MSEATISPVSGKALTLIRASGHVIVDANLPASDLLVLAGAAAQWGASLTVRNAHLRDEGEHVTFDLAE
jgi:hypothetical protein